MTSNLTITTETWTTIREEVRQINPRLFSIIEEISPSDKYPLLKVHYPFGQKILDNGQLLLPTSEDHFEYLTDSSDLFLKKSLNYAAIPVGLVLNNSCEIFIETAQHRIMPLKYLQAGSFLGIFEHLNELAAVRTSPAWSATAGARSVFMLPSISEKQGHKRISHAFNTTPTPPRTYTDQWDIFKTIAKQVSPQWETTLLFFSDKWFEAAEKKDKNWNEFYLFLFKEGWRQLQFVQSETAFSSTWEAFSEITGQKNLNPRTYIANTIKYLFAVMHGAVPAFTFATDEHGGPLEGIKKAYKEVYRLEKYAINFLHPYSVIYGSFPSLYYSMNEPILMEARPKGKYIPNAKEDLREISHLLTVFLKGVENNQFSLLNKEIFLKTNFDFFHVDPDPHYNIQLTTNIPQHDNALNLAHDEKFSASSSFLKGCIRMQEQGKIL